MAVMKADKLLRYISHQRATGGVITIEGAASAMKANKAYANSLFYKFKARGILNYEAKDVSTAKLTALGEELRVRGVRSVRVRDPDEKTCGEDPSIVLGMEVIGALVEEIDAFVSKFKSIVESAPCAQDRFRTQLQELVSRLGGPPKVSKQAPQTKKPMPAAAKRAVRSRRRRGATRRTRAEAAEAEHEPHSRRRRVYRKPDPGLTMLRRGIPAPSPAGERDSDVIQAPIVPPKVKGARYRVVTRSLEPIQPIEIAEYAEFEEAWRAQTKYRDEGAYVVVKIDTGRSHTQPLPK